MLDSKKKILHVTGDSREIYFPEMKVEDFDVSIVPHNLSKICRYNGFIRGFYSVAEHSVMVCRMAEIDHGKGEVGRAALMHDAVEAYLGDVTMPLKHLLPEYQKIERHVAEVIIKALDLPPPNDPVWDKIKEYDRYAWWIEGEALLLHNYPWIRKAPDRYRLMPAAQRLRDFGGMEWQRAHRLMRNSMIEYGFKLHD